MNLLFTDGTLIDKALQAFCWTLLHSLWQGLLFTILTGLGLVLTKKSKAAVRYNIIAILFFLLLAATFTTFVQQWKAGNAGSPADRLLAGSSWLTGMFEAFGLRQLPAILTDYFTAQAPLLVLLWFFIFMIKCVRMTSALVYNERIRHHKIYSPPAGWANKLDTLADQLQLRKKVQLLESGITRIPVVLGHLKPVILVPMGLLSNLPAEQVEAVLLHELAHIRRSDYLMNLFQNLAETVFFFNPGLLWISSLLREERENCCDDIALSQTHNKKQFIEALVSFKEYSFSDSRMAPAFPGKRNQLLQRATRILQNKNKTLNRPEKIFLSVSLLALGMLLIGTVTPPDKNSPPGVLKTGTGQKPPAGGQKIPTAPAFSPRALVSTQETKTALKETTKKQEPVSYEYYSKTITINNGDESIAEREQAGRERAERDEIMMQIDSRKAESDKEQADEDRIQGLKDKEQADEDRIQSLKDMEQSENEKRQAEKDREQIFVKTLPDHQVKNRY